MPLWALAFCTAAGLTLLLTPLLRRVATVTGLVDRPGDHKSHHIPTPYLGGVGVTVSVLLALALDGRLSPRVAAIAFSAALLGTVGLLDDDRTVDPSYRFVVQFGAALAAVVVGVRIHASGVPAIDVALTLLWIIGVTNALNLLDNMDGLAAGVAGVAAAAVFFLAIFARQPVVASLAAAVVGACAGFLVYNRSPASIFMGDAGSLFLGFVVAILTIDVTPALAPPFGFVIPLVILGLPVLDTSTVTLARLRRGRSPAVGGRDHLSHRLVALGLSRGNAVLVLVGVQAVMATLAVLGGRRVVQLRWVALGAFAVLAALSVVTSRAKVYDEPVIGLPRTLRRSLAAMALALPLLSLPALLAMAQASDSTRAGVAAAARALDGLDGDGRRATAAEFGRAGGHFAKAGEGLKGPLVSMGLAVPGVASNLRATRTLASVGRELSATGGRLADVGDGPDLQRADGSVAVDELRRLASELSEATIVLRDSQRRLAAIDRPFLLPRMQQLVRELGDRLDRESVRVDRVAGLARVLPAALGTDGPRRYFLAFQDNAELRGSGGVIRHWGELVADDGHLELSRFGATAELNEAGGPSPAPQVTGEFQKRWPDVRPERFWQHVNMSPDFPTTAKIIGDLYPQSGGQAVDGVIALDAVGLSALLELTGPVMVPDWPQPVTAANVVEVTLRGTYERFPEPDDGRRAQFLGELTRRVAQAFVSVDLGDPRRVADVLSEAAGGGHLLVNLSRPEEQRQVQGLRADGALPEVNGDSLLVVNQNLSANKADAWLRREIRYDVRLDPGDRPATLSGKVEVTLRNGAAAAGVPEAVIRPDDPGVAAGENRTHLSVYTPFAGGPATLNGSPLQLTSRSDLGRMAHSTTVSIPAQSSRTVSTELNGRVRLSEDGWYRLDVLHQPSVVPDDVEVSVTVPAGWRIVEAGGAAEVDERKAEWKLTVEHAETLWLRVDHSSGWARAWDRLRGR